jgi:hypothetical protein
VSLKDISESYPVGITRWFGHFVDEVADESLVVHSMHKQFLGGAIGIDDRNCFVDVVANNPLYFVGFHASSPADASVQFTKIFDSFTIRSVSPLTPSHGGKKRTKNVLNPQEAAAAGVL